MWNWPNPGSKIELNNNNEILIDMNRINNKNFILLKINFFYVKQMLLDNHIHVRSRWIKDNVWIEEFINHCLIRMSWLSFNAE